MRILVLTPTFLPAIGGAELVVLQIYRRLAEHHSIIVLTPYLSENLLNNASSNEYNQLINFDVRQYYERYSFMKIRGHKITQGLIPPFSLSAVIALRHEIKAFQPDVVNVHYVMPTGFAGFYAQKVMKVPTVITYNGRDVPGPGTPFFWKYWHRFIGRNCAAVTFVSKYCRDIICGSTTLAGHIIYNGVENSVKVSDNQKQKLRTKLKLEDDEQVIFALQRLDYLKRVDILIRSMPKIIKHRPNTRLVIGGKGPDLERLKQLAHQIGVAKKVIFVGYISRHELPVYFHIADLFLFHSTYETFGIVLAEAMSYCKAVVSVANTAISEVVDNGKTGLLVPTFDHEKFAGAVLELLNDRIRREEMGNQGFNKVNRFFKWKTIANRYEKVLESVASG